MQEKCLGGVAGERRVCHCNSHLEGKAFPCCHTVVLEKTSPSRIERLCNSRLAHGARQVANGGMWMLQPVHGCMHFRYVLDLLGTNTLTHMLHTHTSTQRCDDRQEGQGRSASSGCLANVLDRVPPRTHTTAATSPLYTHVYDTSYAAGDARAFAQKRKARRADAISPASSSCINAKCGCARRAAFLPPVRAASRSYPLASAEK